MATKSDILSTSQFLRQMRNTPLGNTTALTFGDARALSYSGIDVANYGNSSEISDLQAVKQESSSFWDNVANFFEKGFGALDDVANYFGRGFVSSFEGAADAAIMGIGAIGSWFGADTKWAEDLVKVDVASNLANFTETFANFTPWGIGRTVYNAIQYGGEFWEDLGKAWLGAHFDLGLVGNVTDAEFQEWREKYSYDHSLLAEDTGWFGKGVEMVSEAGGQLVGEIIGFKGMGKLAGALGKGAGWTTKTVNRVTKAGTLGLLGISAAGGGSQEALNNGADFQAAIGYGALVGITEVGTEMIGGIATDVDSGLVGKFMRKTKVGNKVLNTFFGKLIATGMSEGFEEVLSDVANPLWRKVTFEKDLDLAEEYGSQDFVKGLLTSFAVGTIVGSLGGATRAYRSGKFRVNGKKVGSEGYNQFQRFSEADTEFRERASRAFSDLERVEAEGHSFKEGTSFSQAFDEAMKADDVSESTKRRLQADYERVKKAGAELERVSKEFDARMNEMGVTAEDIMEQYGKDVKADIASLKKELGIDIVSDTETFIDENGNAHIATQEQAATQEQTAQETPATEPEGGDTLTMDEAEPMARRTEAIVKDKEGLRGYAMKFSDEERIAKWREAARQRMLEGKSAEDFARFNAANEIIEEITDGDRYYTTREGLSDLVSIMEQANSIEEAREMIAENYESKTSDRVNAGDKEIVKETKPKGRHRWSAGFESFANKMLDSQYALRNTLKQLGLSEARAETIIGKAVNSTSVGVNKALNGFYHVENGTVVKDTVGIYSSDGTGIVNSIQSFAKEHGIEFDKANADIQEALALEHELDRQKAGKAVFGRYVNSRWMNKSFMESMRKAFPELHEAFSTMQTYSEAEFRKIVESAGELTERQSSIVAEIESHMSEMTAEEVARKLEKVRETYPIYDEIKQKYRAFADEILKLRVSSGMMTQEEADLWKEMYPNYIPTYRVILGSGSNVAYGSILTTDMRKAKGSDFVIQDVFSSTIRQAQYVNHFAAVNEALGELYDAAKAYQERTGTNHENVVILDESTEIPRGAQSTEEAIELTRPQISGNTVTLYRDGKAITMQVSDTLLESITALDRGFKKNYAKLGIVTFTEKTAGTMRKLMTTWNPFFSWWRNPLKDVQSALLYTKNGTATLMRNWGRAFSTVFGEAAGKKPSSKMARLYEVYKAEGGQTANVAGMNVYDDISWNESSVKRNLRKFSRTVENFNEVMENTTRFAEFVSTYERLERQGGRTENAMVQEALNDAREITINFARKGTWTAVANRYIPFLTANIEGAARNIRAFISPRSKRELAMIILKMLLLGIVPQAIQEVVYSGDEDYQSLSQTMKANYYLFKVGEEFVRIPKGYVQQAFANGVVAVSRASHGEEMTRDDVLNVLEAQWNAIGVDVSGFFFQPIIDASNNRTWYGAEIVSAKWDSTRPSEQFDRDTSAIAKWLGKVTGTSPLKIDYVLDQMTGVVGDVLLPATSANGYNPLKFVKDQFVTDSVYKNSYSSEFHQFKTERAYRRTEGDPVAAVVSSYLNRVSSDVSELKDMQTKIAESDASEAEKSAQDRVVQATINATYRAAIENAKALEAELANFELSEESIDSDRIEAYRRVLGAEFALQAYNKRVYEKAKCYYKCGVSYDDFYVWYFSARNVGSKEQAEAYLARIRASAQVKNLLFALMGYSLGEEKEAVLRAWLRRKGLAAEEIEMLL